LRAVLGGIAVALGGLELCGLIPRTPVVWAVACVLFVSGANLIVGFLTPVASLLAGLSVLAVAVSWVPAPPLAPVGGAVFALLMAITSVGIALLGPGAFSLDGYLFGRREIEIPPRSPEP
jgi:uncharacterized membrane protein YphA (DoxX/SURF4 family)